MAHTGNTDYLRLPRWALSDKPQMEDFNKAFQVIDEAVAEVTSHYKAGWINASLAEGITISPGYPARYRKEFNTVFLQGWVVGANLGQPIFTLPAGYRPTQNLIYIVPQSSGEAGSNTARLNIQTNGNVFVSRSTMPEYIYEGIGIECSFTTI